MKHVLKIGITAWVGLMSAVVSHPVAGQDTADAGGFDEVIVTATKRGESTLQNTPLSITAITGADLQRTAATEFVDFATRVPNLSFGYTGDGRLNARGIAIRGISGSGTTGFYIDDMPLQEGISPLVLDVERIEVLRGPQGTLYGAQSMGGTIRLVTRQPQLGETFGDLHVSVSDTDEGDVNYAVDGSVNLPLGDKAALRAAAYFDEKSGFFDRVYSDPANPGETQVNENINDATIYGGQLALSLLPTENFDIGVNIWYQNTDESNPPFADFEPGNFVQERPFNVDEPAEDEWVNYNLTLTWDAGPGEFVSSTSYLDRDVFEVEEDSTAVSFFAGLFGFIPAGSLVPVSGPQTFDYQTFAQEIRFASDFEGPFQFVAGLFYLDEDLTATLGPIPVPNAAGGGNAVDDFGSFVVNLGTEQSALFGELYYDLTDRLTMTVGGRLFDIEVSDNSVFGGFFFNFVGANATPGVQTEDGFTPKIQLDYDVNDDMLVYASAAEGFRRGGVNPVPISPACEPELAALGLSFDDTTSFESDSLWNYELGAKSTLAGGRMTLNGSVFFIDWEDIQQPFNLGTCGSRFTSNAGGAEVSGFEIELNLQATDSFWLSVGAGYTDAEISEATPEVPFQVGDPINQVPEWSFATSVDYSFAVFGGREAFIRGDYRYVDESFSFNIVEDASIEPLVRDSYELLDLRTGIQLGNTELALFVKNALNEEANLADTIPVLFGSQPRIVTNRPRTIGIELRTDF